MPADQTNARRAAAGAGVAVRHGTILGVAAEAGATACYGTPFIADERTAWTMKIPEIYLVETVHRPGALASVLQVIADERLVIEHLQSLRRDQDRTLWEITVEIDEQASPNFYAAIDALPYARLVGKSDRVFNRHRGGKIHMRPSLHINTKQILRDIYTPGVARVCLAIREDPSLVSMYTNRPNTVAVVTNGTAILGLGDIGPVAGLPVMEGKAALFAALVNITAVPILIDSRDPARIIETIMAIAPSFGAIQLEDIAAPECFEIESELVRRLDIPVLHDDQHGTAVVALAALLSAMRRVGRELPEAVVGQVGLGAAGIGIARLLRAQGVRRLFGADLRDDAKERLRALGGEPMSLEAGHGTSRRDHRDDRRARTDQAGMGAQGTDHICAIESRRRDRTGHRAGAWRRFCRGWQEHQ